MHTILGEHDQPIVLIQWFAFKRASDARLQISMGFRVTLQMSQERVEQTRASLRDLVALRNDLVLDKFDLWSPEGCLAASSHFSECYSRIDEHYEQLRGWAKSMDNARATGASFGRSPIFTDLVIKRAGNKEVASTRQ